MNYNKVILIGNATRDPQLSYLPSQTPVVELGLAVNRRWKDKDGQQKEETCFVECRAFSKMAETLNQYMTKGKPILVEGRLQFSAWESKDGQKRNKLRVIIENFQFLSDGKSTDATHEADSQESAPQPTRPPTRPPTPQPGPQPIPDDDIPF